MDSTVPWRDRTKVIIQCNMLHFKTANPNILSVLTQINPKLMYVGGYAPELRLKTYPTFRNVVFLSVNNLDFRNMAWLNAAILKMRIPFNITSAKQFNAGLNSLNLYALHLTDNRWNVLTKLDLTISMPELQFLAFGSDLNVPHFDNNAAAEPVQASFLKTLDLSKCVSLLGIHFFMKVPFSSIVWNKEYPLKFVNVAADDRLEKQDVSYCTEWYNAYENGGICSDMVIGHCFFKTAAKVYRWRFLPRKHGIATRFSAFAENEGNNERKRCKKRRSMDFDELVEYIGNKSNIGWCQFTENALLSEAYFVKQIAKNVPRKKDDDGDE